MTGRTASTPSSLGTVFNSLISPFKKLWDFPPIHLSTFYGESNQHGRPGPVLIVMVDRFMRCRSRVKQKSRKPHKSVAKNVSLDNSLLNTGGESPKHTLKNNAVRQVLKTVAVSSVTSHSREDQEIPEVDGILIVTPRAIERYYVDGVLVKRVIPPDTVTCCFPSIIPGIGRALVCGTQSGRIYIFDRVSFDFKFVFDPTCLNQDFLILLGSLLEPNKAFFPSVSNTPGSSRPCTLMSTLRQSPCLVSSLMMQWYFNLSWVRSSHVETPVDLTVEAQQEGNEQNVFCSILPPSSKHIYVEAPVTLREDIDKLFVSESVFECFTTSTGIGVASALLNAMLQDLRQLKQRCLKELALHVTDPKRAKNFPSTLSSHQKKSAVELSQSTQVHSDFSSKYLIEEKEIQLFQLFQECISAKREICKVFVTGSFECFGDCLLAGDSHGHIYVWNIPSGSLTHVLNCPVLMDPSTLKASSSMSSAVIETLKSPSHVSQLHVSALLVVSLSGTEHHLWACFGNGLLVIYNLKTGDIIQLLSESCAIRLLEFLPRMSLVISLNEYFTVTAWETFSQQRVTTLTHHQITGGLPITCLKCIESEKYSRGLPQATFILGCVNGSIFIHRLFWEEFTPFIPYASDSTGSGTNIPQHDTSNMQNDANNLTNSSNDASREEKRRVSCRIYQYPDTEPSCPICSLWVDPLLNALLIGDASGIVATLQPIEKLLDTLETNLPQQADYSNCQSL